MLSKALRGVPEEEAGRGTGPPTPLVGGVTNTALRLPVARPTTVPELHTQLCKERPPQHTSCCRQDSGERRGLEWSPGGAEAELRGDAQ